MSLWARVRDVFAGDRVNREIDEELGSHLDEAIARGRDAEEARRALGSPLLHRERSHDVRVITWLDALRADAIFGLRQIRKNAVASAAAILSLALAIGGCTAAFRIIDAILLRPLPVEHPARLYLLSRQGNFPFGHPQTSDGWEYPLFARMRAAVKEDAELIAISYMERSDLRYSFSAASGSSSSSPSDDEMERANRQFVSGWMFGTLGLQPALGRLFTEQDDRTPGAHPYGVLSYDYWTRRFGRDPPPRGPPFCRTKTDVGCSRWACSSHSS
jgi:hypothetical protein